MAVRLEMRSARGLAALALIALSTTACHSALQRYSCDEPKPPPPGPFCADAGCTVAGANLGRSNRVNDVAAFAQDDVWAVGSTQFGSGRPACPEGPPDLHGSEALIEHWDGSEWRVASTGLAKVDPSSLYDRSELTAVSGSAPNDVWAVGTGTHGASVFLHWDAHRWQQVPGPAHISAGTTVTGETGLSLTDVVAVSPNDAWVAGSFDDGAILLHWDGSAWSQLPVTVPPYSWSPRQESRFDALAATGPADVWAVGNVHTVDSSLSILPSRPLIEHFDGRRWRVVPTPVLPGALGNGSFLGVAAVSPSDAWAVGLRSGKRPGAFITLAEHWDGTAWSIVASPNGHYGGDLRSVAAVPDARPWAVGDTGDDPLILGWDGGRWVRLPAPTFPEVGNTIEDVSIVPSGGVWAAGWHGYFGARDAAYFIRVAPVGGDPAAMT